MKNYIGLDAHSTTSTFVSLNYKGEMISRCQVKTSEKNLIGFIGELKGEKKLVFEESHLSQWLYVLLKDEVDELIVCNPFYLSKRQGPKNDFKDAFHLADELRINHVTPVFHEATEMMELRTLVSGYLWVNKQIARCKNRFKSFFIAEALPVKGKKIYSAPERVQELSNSIDQFVAAHLYKDIQYHSETKLGYLKEFEKNRKKHSVIRKLCTVPGINTVRAVIIAALVCSPSRFENKHKFWAYSMLVKYMQESDGVLYGKKMIQGRRELKCVFIGAAQSVLQLSRETSLGKYYDRMRSKGVEHDAALFNVARRIAAISLSILKHNKAYDDHHEEKQRRSLKLRQSV